MSLFVHGEREVHTTLTLLEYETRPAEQKQPLMFSAAVVG
jgi:hypothetical protein